jgi:hypothetical protein
MSSKVCNCCNCPCRAASRLQHSSTPIPLVHARRPRQSVGDAPFARGVHGENGPPPVCPGSARSAGGGEAALAAGLVSGACGGAAGLLPLPARTGESCAAGVFACRGDRRSSSWRKRGCISAVHGSALGERAVLRRSGAPVLRSAIATTRHPASAAAASAASHARSARCPVLAGSPTARRARRLGRARPSPGSSMTLRSRAPGCPTENCSSSRLSHPSSCVMRVGVLADTSSSHEGSLFSLI